MRDWKSVLGVLLVFVLGGLAGTFLSMILVHHRVTTLLERGSPAYEQLLEHRLVRGLHLDAEQRDRFHDALMTNIEERKKLQVQLQPQVQALNQETKREFRQILTPEQLVTLRRNMEDFRRHFGSPGLGRALDADDGKPSSGPNETATNGAPR